MNEQHFNVHLREIHGILSYCSSNDDASWTHDSGSYTVHMPFDGVKTSCPVPNCPATLSTHYSMRRHFASRHAYASVWIPESASTVRCPQCHQFLSRITSQHLLSKTCALLASHFEAHAQRRHRDSLLSTMEFRVDNALIGNVFSVKYLGRWISEDDSDDLAISMNIKKARNRWSQIYRLLSRDRARPKTMACFYRAVLESVLLYSSETWTLSKRQLLRLERFHRRCSRCIAHHHIQRHSDGTWSYPDTNEVLDLCGLSPVSTYIAKCKTTLLHYASTYSPLYRRCLNSSPSATSAHHIMWLVGQH